jgi:SAM-dependent methyltransferase
VTGERLDERLARLERERRDADRAYNDALTALDRAVAALPADLPEPPADYDAARLPELNAVWNILPDTPPATDRSIKGRLRGLVWRLVGPTFDRQRAFNSVLVDHLNRNARVHRDTRRALESVIALQRKSLDALLHFQGRLIAYLQTLTLYVDTKDRSTAGGIDVLNAGLSAVADDWLKRWESLAVREARLTARATATDDLRASVALAQQTALAVKRELERFAAGASSTASTPTTSASTTGAPPAETRGETRTPSDATAQAGATVDLDAFKYVGFEDAFRGPQDEITRRLSAYAPRFDGLSDIVDLGCGRGEFLSLLAARGLSARGVDTNAAMVETSRARGLDVTHGDALGFLKTLPDASVGGIFAAQVVEHLPPDYLASLIETAAFKMRPGGLLILETINPACWLAFFESYIRDLTHVRPLHPETLQFLVRASGFQSPTLEFLSPVPEAARLETVPAALAAESPVLGQVIEVVNDNAAKLNARLFTYQDYAVSARR